MQKVFCFLVLWMMISFAIFSQIPNSLSSEEKNNGWALLFDGKTTSSWHSANGKTFPATGWHVQNGELGIIPVPGSTGGGDIVTLGEYSDFDFMTDFKISVGANSGIKYFYTKYEKGGTLGLEFQILDDEVNEDAKLGHDGNRVCGAFYDMIPPSANRKLNKVGEWNTARIISRGKHVEHWLNGIKILEFDRGGELYLKALKNSKFKEVIPVFGEVSKGRILLQYHGSEVWFRNIKIRKL